MERLIERGPFSDRGGSNDGQAEGQSEAGEPPAQAVTKLPVFERISHFNQRLVDALSAPAQQSFDASIRESAGEIAAICEFDSDSALASVLVPGKVPYALRLVMNTAVLTEVMLRTLEQPETLRRSAGCAALTMNLAIMDLQDQLYHQSSPLEPEQKQRMWQHPTAGAQRLEQLGVTDQDWLRAVREHHEAIDGSGYPGRLSGEAIGLAAQVISIADRYCAMVSERAYRPGVLPNIALREIFVKHGKGIDARLAALLVKEVGTYPPGSVVRLANGETGVVIKRTLNANQPVVKAFKGAKGNVLAQSYKRLTSKPMHEVTGVLSREKLGIDIDFGQLLDAAAITSPDAD